MTDAVLVDQLVLVDEHDTRALGGAVAQQVRAGDTVVLSGGLGVGKTTFVKGFVASLDTAVEVSSPTFALCHRYDCSPPVAHVDCWRMEREREIDELALEELIDDGWIVLAEWGERYFEHFGASSLVVTISIEGDHRIARLSSSSPRWLECTRELERATRGIGRERC